MWAILKNTFLFFSIFSVFASADPAPDINVVDLDGNWHNLNTYVSQGKYVALDFVTLN